jgi:hypothetical protein
VELLGLIAAVSTEMALVASLKLKLWAKGHAVPYIDVLGPFTVALFIKASNWTV